MAENNRNLFYNSCGDQGSKIKLARAHLFWRFWRKVHFWFIHLLEILGIPRLMITWQSSLQPSAQDILFFLIYIYIICDILYMYIYLSEYCLDNWRWCLFEMFYFTTFTENSFQAESPKHTCWCGNMGIPLTGIVQSTIFACGCFLVRAPSSVEFVSYQTYGVQISFLSLEFQPFLHLLSLTIIQRPKGGL